MDSYQKLVARFKEVQLLRSTSAILEWDEQTYLPKKAVQYRADQLSYLASKAHLLGTAPEVGDWLTACEQAAYPADSDEAANVYNWRHDYNLATKLPVTFVEEFERTAALAREAWKEARQAANFAGFQSHLEKVIDLSKQKADRFGYKASPYDALMDQFEPGATVSYLTPIFAELKSALVDLVQTISSGTQNGEPLAGKYPVAEQQTFNRQIAAALGYDFDAGRIDTTTHPFATSLGPDDQRITTRYDETLFQVSLYGIMHETGHGLYEQGLAKEAFGTPLGTAASLGIHESQSRLWENHVGRSASFWDRWHADAVRYLPDLNRFDPDAVIRGVQQVRPSFIRVEADEVTYDLHILLRFEIEVGLIEGKIAVSDLPAIWNERFAELFGIKVPNDRIGVLQDIHWSLGALGYFPTYTLGNLNAAQLMNRASSDIAGLNDSLADGEYRPLLDWLRHHIHRYGRRYLPNDLMARATGEPTQARYRIEYLREKYGRS
ncbi:MAG: carboxypeptidase M32 [Verrucomicrobia bacterium]|nr:carboxypeptidase M32 [Verrucomicrobiota bacterium]MBV8484006.1 carboxypeptidase M32 [Verrucomicrobiota bacterium]